MLRIKSVRDKIRWLVMAGSMWRKMMRDSGAPAKVAAVTKLADARRSWSGKRERIAETIAERTISSEAI
jgi:hypothetical protein